MKHLPCVKHCTRYFTWYTNLSNQLMEKGLLSFFFVFFFLEEKTEAEA